MLTSANGKSGTASRSPASSLTHKRLPPTQTRFLTPVTNARKRISVHFQLLPSPEARDHKAKAPHWSRDSPVPHRITTNIFISKPPLRQARPEPTRSPGRPEWPPPEPPPWAKRPPQ